LLLVSYVLSSSQQHIHEACHFVLLCLCQKRDGFNAILICLCQKRDGFNAIMKEN